MEELLKAAYLLGCKQGIKAAKDDNSTITNTTKAIYLVNGYIQAKIQYKQISDNEFTIERYMNYINLVESISSKKD